MRKNPTLSIIILVAFCLQFIFTTFDTKPMRSAIFEFTNSNFLYNLVINLIQGFPMIIAMFMLFPAKKFGEVLGLKKNILVAIVVTFLSTLPMSIGGLVTNGLSEIDNYDRLFTLTFNAGFFEELMYRAFCFGLLFRYAGWGFIPASLFTALLFGSVHLYQASDPLAALMVFTVTGLGNVLFAWLYTEWNYNLWVPIFVHAFMNLWWAIFSLGSNAAGGLWANIFRFASVALIIAFTIWYKKRKGWKYEINKNTLWRTQTYM